MAGSVASSIQGARVNGTVAVLHSLPDPRIPSVGARLGSGSGQPGDRAADHPRSHGCAPTASRIPSRWSLSNALIGAANCWRRPIEAVSLRCAVFFRHADGENNVCPSQEGSRSRVGFTVCGGLRLSFFAWQPANEKFLPGGGNRQLGRLGRSGETSHSPISDKVQSALFRSPLLTRV